MLEGGKEIEKNHYLLSAKEKIIIIMGAYLKMVWNVVRSWFVICMSSLLLLISSSSLFMVSYFAA